MEWTGKWITGPAQVDDDEKVPPYLFRKKIEIKREKEIARATLYASALGVYTFRINGNRVGDRGTRSIFTGCSIRNIRSRRC